MRAKLYGSFELTHTDAQMSDLTPALSDRV